LWGCISAQKTFSVSIIISFHLTLPSNYWKHSMPALFEKLNDTFGPYTNIDPIEATSHAGGGVTVGVTPSMIRQEVLKRAYHDSQAHKSSLAFYGSCMPPTLEVPSEHMPVLVENALESLSPTDWASFKANKKPGQEAFDKRLRASLARFANDPWETAPQTSPRTDRSANVAVHTAPREHPMAFSINEPIMVDDGPPIVSIRTEGRPGTGCPISIASISVEIPYIVDPVPGSLVSRLFGPKKTLKPESFAGLVSKLAVLGPSIGQELNSLLGDCNEETRDATEKKIASMIGAEVNTIFKFDVVGRNLDWPDPANRSRTVQSDWGVQEVPGNPRLEATMRGEERSVANSTTAHSMA
jgi:hypothetical protein